MARPFKSGVGYFPLDVVLEDEVELIESEHNIIGFAVLIKLYQKIYASDYWVKWDKKSLIVFSKRINVDHNQVNVIINSCFEWGLFDEKLFKKYQILTSKGIQKRFFEIVKRRKNIEVMEDYLLIDPLVYVDINSINVIKSTQSIVKESIVKDINKELIHSIVDYLNQKLGTKFKPNSDKTKSCINARINEKYNLDDFKTVIDKKYDQWINTDSAKYLRPETLFGTKFDGYLNEVSIKQINQFTNKLIFISLKIL